jgi:hypothetical protein
LSSAIQINSSLYRKAIAGLLKFQPELVNASTLLIAVPRLFLKIKYYFIAIRLSMKVSAMNFLIFGIMPRLSADLLFVNFIILCLYFIEISLIVNFKEIVKGISFFVNISYGEWYLE